MNTLRRRALLDLFGERGARRVGDNRLLAGLLLPLGVDGIERILEAGGGENDDIASLGWARAGSGAAAATSEINPNAESAPPHHATVLPARGQTL